MKVKIILAIVWASLCVCERQQRSTVLTDESKRILEHFDFSNFDKQEALNYLDRQRYENQIRGKRSQSKFKGDHSEENDKILGAGTNLNELQKSKAASKPNFEPQIFENDDTNQITNRLPFLEFSEYDGGYHQTPETIASATRCKRGHRSKKKNRSKSQNGDEMNDKEEKKHRKRKKKKKKKRHYWDSWSEWSPCSVTCGRGRKIRWRKCIAKNCTNGELEMGEKTCQLPACNLLTKLLGL